MNEKEKYIRVLFEKDDTVKYEKDGRIFTRKYHLLMHHNKTTQKNVAYYGWFSKKQNRILWLWIKSGADVFLLKKALLEHFHRHRNSLTGVCVLYRVKQSLKDESLVPVRKNGKPLPDELYDSEFTLIKKLKGKPFDFLIEEPISGKKFIVASENFELSE